MKPWKIATIAAFGVLAVALITASVLAYNYARFGPNWPMSQNRNVGDSTPYSETTFGYPQTRYPNQTIFQPTIAPYYSQTTYPQYGGWSYGTMGGCIGRTSSWGYSTMGGWGGGMRGGCMGRMGGWGWSYPNNEVYTNPITLTQAVTIAEDYVTSLNNPDLAVAQVQEYTQTFHVSTIETSTGIGAFELLIDKYTGTVYAEMGPNMMWNTKYGMVSGFQGAPTAVMSVTEDQAITNAKIFLDTNVVGTTTGEVTAYYGYYNIEILYSGQTFGILSVNGYTGQVWHHTWLGIFIQELQP